MPLYAGMTVNESLVISGQIVVWDQAAANVGRSSEVWPSFREGA
jgi:hypothetical protein